MSDDSDLEKSHPASPQRLEKAREEGQVPRSRDLVSFALLAAALAVAAALADTLAQALARAMEAGVRFDPRAARDDAVMLSQAGRVFALGLPAGAPVLGALFVAALATPLVVGGWLLSAQSLAPKWERLDPVQGLARMVSGQALAELVKTVLKALLVGAVAAWILAHQVPQLLDLLHTPLTAALPAALSLALVTCLVVLVPLGVLALLDAPYQLWTHHQRLRMSLEEVKKEHKESEGDPLVKAQMRRQRQQMARRRMMTEVPAADVVLTNPTHYAVALRYDEGAMRAPRVVAKGTELVAQRIREIAQAHRIPMLETPPLARALYRHTDLGQEIPAALYTAVAEVLAWAMQLRRGGRAAATAIPRPRDLPVPADLDPHTAAPGRQAPSLVRSRRTR